jgi:uncharacterized membrane protein
MTRQHQLLISFFILSLLLVDSFRKQPRYLSSIVKPRISPRRLNASSNEVDNSSPPTIMLSILSLTGVVESSYLTWSKYASADVSTLCLQGKSCSDVLQSPYSSIPGINLPLTLVAFLSYSVVLLLSQASSRSESSSEGLLTALLFITTAMATFSGYLMLLLTFVLHDACSYCYLSAFLSISLAAIVYSSSSYTKRTAVSRSAAISTTLASALLFLSTSSLTQPSIAAASTAPIAQLTESNIRKFEKNVPATITTVSTEQSLNLAKRLKALDAKMYGAYWCSHCFNQKQNLGKEAFEMVDYVECDKNGFDNQYPLCKEKKVSCLILIMLMGDIR